MLYHDKHFSNLFQNVQASWKFCYGFKIKWLFWNTLGMDQHEPRYNFIFETCLADFTGAQYAGELIYKQHSALSSVQAHDMFTSACECGELSANEMTVFWHPTTACVGWVTASLWLNCSELNGLVEMHWVRFNTNMVGIIKWVGLLCYMHSVRIR